MMIVNRYIYRPKKKKKIPDYQKKKNKTKKWTLSTQDVFKLNLAAGGSFV